MKSKIVGKVLSQLNMKVEKRTSGTLAGKRVKDAEMINLKMAAEEKVKDTNFLWLQIHLDVSCQKK